MLTMLSADNFKSWPKLGPMRLARITGLFGANSSGKSSILQLLLMLKQTADSPDRAQVFYLGEEKSEKSLAVLGNIDDVLHKGAAERRIACALAWTIDQPLDVRNPEDPNASPILRGSDIEFECEVESLPGKRLSVTNMQYSFSRHQFSMRLRGNESGRYDVSASGHAFEFKRIQGRPPESFPPPVKCYGFPDQVRAAFQNAGVLSDLEFEFERQMQRTYYLGPLREFPFRDYRWSGAEPVDMGRRGEKVVSALLAARQRGARVGSGRGRRLLEEWVAQRLKELGLIHHFEIEEIKKESNLYRVSVQRSTDSERVLLPDVGFGVSQVLPVVVICYYVPRGSTILLEQPEIHLHPRAQEALADVLIDAVEKQDVQIIVESHSEHLMRRLQRRIAEEKLAANDVALYFCNAKNGASELVPLELNLVGEIENWPTGFFGDEMNEIAAMHKARLKRQARTA